MPAETRDWMVTIVTPASGTKQPQRCRDSGAYPKLPPSELKISPEMQPPEITRLLHLTEPLQCERGAMCNKTFQSHAGRILVVTNGIWAQNLGSSSFVHQKWLANERSSVGHLVCNFAVSLAVMFITQPSRWQSGEV
jgi:hypothetical protein